MTQQIVLMTGCSSGIGLAAATRLARDPDKRFIVIATIIAMSEKNDLEVAVGDALDKTVFIRELDITNDDDVTAVVQSTLKTHRRIDVLINIAGIAFCDVLERVTREKIDHIFAVNVFGAIRLTQAVVPQMKNRKSGKIITVTSIAGKMAWPYLEMYSSTKFALEGFFESLAISVRTFKISVCMVEPGKVDTGLLVGLREDFESITKDEGVNDIDRHQIQSLNDAVEATSSASPEDVVGSIMTCLEEENPVLRHPLSSDFDEAVRNGAMDTSGETIVGLMRKLLGK